MKKLFSLIRACMSSDMNLFKVSNKKHGKGNIILPIVIAIYLMGYIAFISFGIFSEFSKTNTAYVLLSVFAFGITLLTFIEGIYKTGSLLFGCKDDDLLLSLPIKRSTVIFIRILKFYVFELLYNSIFLLPIVIVYGFFHTGSIVTYIITSIFMILLLPVIPIAISSIVGAITTSISSKFKYKNIIEIIFSFAILVLVFSASMNGTKVIEYLIENASKFNDLIVKYYYPAGVFGKLANNFNVVDLLIFIGINIVIFVLTIFMISKVYFRINSNAKVSKTKVSKNKNYTIKARFVKSSLIRKELNTFFNIPVFIINSGFGLVLFLIIVIVMILKIDVLASVLNRNNIEGGLTADLMLKNIPSIILLVLAFTSFMTSITSSVISLEGRNINILKTLPIKVKDILMSKIYACMIITTPVLLIGILTLYIKFKFSIIELLLLIILAIIMPLISHFIGILVNLRYPKLDAENSAEVVKQSTSSLVSVLIGMGIMFISIFIIVFLLIVGINTKLVLIGFIVVSLIVDIILNIILSKWGTKKFSGLEV